MKRIYPLLSALLCAVALTGCVEQMSDIVEELNLARRLQPTGVTCAVRNGDEATFKWNREPGVASYVLEVFSAGEGATPLETLGEIENFIDSQTAPSASFTVSKDEVPFTAKLDADVVLYFRLKALGADPSKDSKWYIHDEAIETSAIKSALDPEVAARASSSITLKWKNDPEVNQIWVSPAIDGSDKGVTKVDLTSAEVSAAQAQVKGLKPSTRYTLAVHYKSADRGSVEVWTTPDETGATAVADTSAFKQAVADGAKRILLTNTGDEYAMGNIAVTSDIAIVGKIAPDGSMPTVRGGISISGGVASVICEAVNFDGGASADGKISQRTHHITVTDVLTSPLTVSVVNCSIFGYQRGIFYDSSKASDYAGFTYEGDLIYDIPGDGGDFFDVRKSKSIGSILFKNTTIYGSGRTLFRIDDGGGTFGSFEMSNCTLSELVCTQTSNNNGILHIRAKLDPANFFLRDNLILNMQMASTGYCQLISHNASAVVPAAANISGNCYYNCSDDFFTHPMGEAKTEAFGVAMATAGGGEILSEDPCANSLQGKFFVTSEKILASRKGDPRWLTSYVEEPEDLSNWPVTVPIKDWNFSNTKLFGKSITKDMIRDGIRFYVKDAPINMGAGMEFTAAGSPENGECCAAFKISQPGSVVLSTGDGDGLLVLALDGDKMIGLPANMPASRMIFGGFAPGEEHTVQIYGTGAITVTALQWNDDAEASSSSELDAPVLTADKTEVAFGADDAVTISWDDVAKAGSYDVTVNGTTKNVAASPYKIGTSSLPAGDYTVTVVAVPAETDHVRTASQPAQVNFSVVESLSMLTGAKTWGADYFTAQIEKWGSGTEVKTAFVADKLGYVPGASKFKFAVDNADTAPKPRVQTGGAGEPGTKASLQLMLNGKGTISMKVRSSGDAARYVYLANGSTVLVNDTSLAAPDKSSEPATVEYLVDAAPGDILNIYCSGAINFYEIKWTPYEAPSFTPSTYILNFNKMYEDAVALKEPYTLSSGTKYLLNEQTITQDIFTVVSVSARTYRIDVVSSDGNYDYGDYVATCRLEPNGASNSTGGRQMFVEPQNDGVLYIGTWGSADRHAYVVEASDKVTYIKDFTSALLTVNCTGVAEDNQKVYSVPLKAGKIYCITQDAGIYFAYIKFVEDAK